MSINLPELSTDLNAHQNLDNQPSLTASELKAAWDKPANDIKTYINNLLIPGIENGVESELDGILEDAKDYTDEQIGSIDLSAENISYDNSVSGLAATDVQAAADELKTGLNTTNGNVSSLATRVSNLENGSGGTKTSSAITVSNGTKDYEETLKKQGTVLMFLNVKNSNVPSGGKTVIGTLASGYRPTSNIKRKCLCQSSTGGGNTWCSDLYISTGGTVQIDNQSGFVAEEYNFDTYFTVV